ATPKHERPILGLELRPKAITETRNGPQEPMKSVPPEEEEEDEEAVTLLSLELNRDCTSVTEQFRAGELSKSSAILQIHDILSKTQANVEGNPFVKAFESFVSILDALMRSEAVRRCSAQHKNTTPVQWVENTGFVSCHLNKQNLKRRCEVLSGFLSWTNL
ncbi:hypothetical protein H0H81_009218, partial [Sphagnurus paluster]